MRPVDRDAGSRRRLLQAGAGLLAALCTGCAAGAARRGDALLEPLFSIAGARLIARMDVAGGAAPGAIGPHVPLLFPVAVAAAFNDIYIADAGAARLYRYDRALDAMAVLPETRIGPATRLQAGADGSIYVLDPFVGEIRRYTRGGRPLPPLRPRLATSRYSDFALDAATGKIYAVDSAQLAIDEIQPLGQLAIEYQRIEEPGPIAADGRGLYLGSAACGCVGEWIRGRPGRRFGAGQLRQPLALALLGPQLFALDGVDRSVVLAHEAGVDALTPAALGLLQPESLAAAGGLLLVADGAGRRVTAFRPRRS
ncbi:MAG: hypothetical protein HZC24_04245 [Rhodocyclales bacterium]|nr:hypothetical protein [Rhodocyclales bacterium]